MQYESMGLLVVRKTYSIAVACLDPEVVEEAPEDLFGQFLVINEPVSKWAGIGPDTPPVRVMDIQNRLYNPEEFELTYKLVGKHEPGQFFRVKRIRNDERFALLEASGKPVYNYPRNVRRPGRIMTSRNGFAR